MDSKPLQGLKVVSLTTAHAPTDERIFYKEARTLVRFGADVVIVHPAIGPEPKVTDGVRFAAFPGGVGKLRRVRMLATARKAVATFGADVVHCHEPDALWAALPLKRSRDLKVIFDSHEMWGAVVAGHAPRMLWGITESLFKRFERRWLARCDAAVGASWAITDFLASILGPDRVETILNVPLADLFGESRPREWGDVTYLCHDGTLGFDRGLITIVQAVELVARKHRVVLKVVGDVFGDERVWLDRYVREHHLEGVIVRTGWLPYEEVGAALAPCHIGLIALQRTPNNVVTSSNKVFNYLLYGIPFIGPSYRLAKLKLVHEEHCGLLADSASPESYAAAITQMIENRNATLEMGRNALRASREKYRWSHMEGRLLAVYRKSLAGR